MNIRDAIKTAVKKGRGIRRSSWGEEGPLLIPTNTIYCFILITSENKMVPRWSPDTDDLSAGDWEVRMR